jgi:hypothetical protein
MKKAEIVRRRGKKARKVFKQYAALPDKLVEGELRVRLVTSREAASG